MNGMPIPSDRSPTYRPIRGRTQHYLAKPILCWLLSPFSSRVLLYPHSHCPTRKSSFCCFLFPLNRRHCVLSPQSTHNRMQLLCAQSCPSLCGTMDYSLPGSWAHGIFQARTQRWVAISYSRGSSWPRDQTHVSCISCSYPFQRQKMDIFFLIVWHTHSSGWRDLFLCVGKFPFSPESSKCTREKTLCFHTKRWASAAHRTQTL